MSKPEEEILPSFDFPESTPPPEAAPEPVPVIQEKPAVPLVQVKCACCGAVRRREDAFCGDCGWFHKEPFPSDEELATGAVVEAAPLPSADPVRVKGRYELIEQIADRLGVERFMA